MPSATMKSLAKKAGKALSTVEGYWKKAIKDAASQDVDNKYAYATGIVKKRLGLEAVDLALCGVDIFMLCECFDDADRCEDVFDRTLFSIGLSKLLETRSTSFSEQFVRRTLKAINEYSLEDLKKLFPNVCVDYLKVLVSESVGPGRSKEEFYKLFPNVDHSYLKALVGESVKSKPLATVRNEEMNEFGTVFKPGEKYAVLDRSRTTCTLYEGDPDKSPIDSKKLITLPFAAAIFEMTATGEMADIEAYGILDAYSQQNVEIADIYDQYEVSAAINRLDPSFVYSNWSHRLVDDFLRMARRRLHIMGGGYN